MVPSERIQPGTVVGERYRVDAPLRRGVMSELYEAVHLETERACVLKLLAAHCVGNDEMVQRFRRECRATAAIDSHHVISVFDAGVHQTGQPYLVMPRLRGRDLGALIRADGPVSPEDAIPYLWQAAIGLDAAHGADVVHRDLKPSNLFLSHHADGSPHITIIDFGIAKVSDGLTPPTRSILGTPMYLAPEQVRPKRGKVGPATDRHALTHVAYTLLSGEPYWLADDEEADSEMQLMLEVTMGLPVPASQRARERGDVRLPEAFDVWFAKGCAVDPDARFPTATESIRALAAALGVAAPGGNDEPLDSRPPLRRRRSWLPVGIGAALVAVCGFALGTRTNASAEPPTVVAPDTTADPSREAPAAVDSTWARDAPPADSQVVLAPSSSPAEPVPPPSKVVRKTHPRPADSAPTLPASADEPAWKPPVLER